MQHTELKSEFPAVICLHYSVTGQYTFSFTAYISLMISLTRNSWYKVWFPIADLVLQKTLLQMLNSDQFIIQQYNRIRTSLCLSQFYVMYYYYYYCCCCDTVIWWGMGEELVIEVHILSTLNFLICEHFVSSPCLLLLTTIHQLGFFLT
jgi:hypothetical protein